MNNKIKQAIKDGRLIDFDDYFTKLPKKEQEEIKVRSKFIVASMEIRRLRKSENLTQVQLAKKINVKREYISRIESGEQNVTLETLIKIANAVGKEFKFKFE
jgi:DNA-binding XRE family transcriptional regulator